MATDTTAIYTTALRNTHALESQGLSQIEHQLSGLEHYPDYANLLRAHVQTTQEQLKRLEQALSSLSTSASTLKESVTNTAGKVGAAVHALAQDETLKNLYAGYGYQYHQIAAYRSLIAIAEAAGAPRARGTVPQIARGGEASGTRRRWSDRVSHTYLRRAHDTGREG
jgi:ferritin-like metal-binding protein YciE